MPNYIASAPLVGAHFHPPAKALLAQLRTGTELTLRREPDNPYDSNAIGVWLNWADVGPVSEDQLRDLASSLAGYGWSVDDIDGPVQLGHIAAKTGEAASIAPLMDSGESPTATLGFNMNGQPIVRLEWDHA